MKSLISFVLVWILPFLLFASVIKVPSYQYPTIQSGIDSALVGDTILVWPNTYYENINFKGKSIVIGSLSLIMGDTSIISHTIIDGDNNGSAVVFQNNEYSKSVLVGFTIKNGNGTVTNFASIFYYSAGGGIFCFHASPIIKNCKIIENNADMGGGIACINNSFPILKNIIIIKNNAYDDGGGLYCDVSQATLENVAIVNNTTSGRGGGIISWHNSNIIMKNITVAYNTSELDGGGIFIWDDPGGPVITNSIFYKNIPDEIYIGGETQSRLDICYSDIFGGQDSIGKIYDPIVNWREGNIDADPIFIDCERYNYLLHENSPCIDKGTTFYVLENDTILYLQPSEYYGLAPDMGAFESQYNLVNIDNERITPKKVLLYQNYPNPFNSLTKISYFISNSDFVVIKIFDTLGRKVQTLVNKFQTTGNYTVNFNAKNLSSGIYFYKLHVGNKVTEIKKMILMR
jgi:hypothetical protein